MRTDNDSHPVPRGRDGVLPCALVSSELAHQRTPSSRPDLAGAGSVFCGLHSLVRAPRHALHRSETSSWVDAEIYVVYVEKRGFRFRETSIAAWRDGKAYVTQEVRKALRYRSQGITHRVVLSRETLRRVFDLVRSPEFKALQTERRKSPIQRNSNTSYISGHGRPALIYSDVDKDEPPREIVDWFHEVGIAPRRRCLGVSGVEGSLPGGSATILRG
jgi:hypothetical protein